MTLSREASEGSFNPVSEEREIQPMATLAVVPLDEDGFFVHDGLEDNGCGAEGYSQARWPVHDGRKTTR